jgi:hypothetical protein
LKTALFCSPFNRAIQIISLLITTIPIFGFGWIFTTLILFFCKYGSSYRYKNGKYIIEPTNDLDDVLVRDSKITRWLFNEIDWDIIDARKQNSIK